MQRVGLVLGAGGLVGQAYHAAVLSVLDERFGVCDETVDIVVGTSAGAATGALLRLGVSAADLAAWTANLPLAGDSALNRQMTANRPPTLPPIDPVLMLLRRPTLPGTTMITRAIVRPWQFRPLAAALALLAPGMEDIEERLAPLVDLEQAPWPARDLWICAVRRLDGRRVVFGRAGSPSVPLHRAVAASCAVPGYFAPVRIAEHTYVDGGAHSPTNAATLARRPLDLVVLVSPMSGPGRGRSLAAAARRHSRRRLDRERIALHRAGVPTVVFSPGPAEQDAMGDDMLSNDRLADVVTAAADGARATSARPEIERLLHGVATGTARGPRATG